MIRLAVPEKCCARRCSLAFFDRCGNCGFAASAPGGAKPQFPLLRRRNKYPPSVGWGIFVWRRRRDLNPRGVFRHPTPLAGEPLRPLGYFCMPLGYSSTAGRACQGKSQGRKRKKSGEKAEKVGGESGKTQGRERKNASGKARSSQVADVRVRRRRRRRR